MEIGKIYAFIDKNEEYEGVLCDIDNVIRFGNGKPYRSNSLTFITVNGEKKVYYEESSFLNINVEKELESLFQDAFNKYKERKDILESMRELKHQSIVKENELERSLLNIYKHAGKIYDFDALISGFDCSIYSKESREIGFVITKCIQENITPETFSFIEVLDDTFPVPVLEVTDESKAWEQIGFDLPKELVEQITANLKILEFKDGSDWNEVSLHKYNKTLYANKSIFFRVPEEYLTKQEVLTVYQDLVYIEKTIEKFEETLSDTK